MPPILLLAALAFLTAAALAQPQAPFKDPRDGKKYKTVKIGEQVWMAENLQFAADSSKCYENKAENCKKYGRLYDWNAAMEACPSGWHLPSNEEWDELHKFIDSSYDAKVEYNKVAGEHLKATSGWNDIKTRKPCNYMDKFGFTALPGGKSRADGGYFTNIGYGGVWWSATECSSIHIYSQVMYYSYKCYDSFKGGTTSNLLYSVRCVRD